MPEAFRFRSMGCEVVVQGATRSERTQVQRLFRSREQIFSRFIPGSELNRVNGAADRPVHVSRAFADMLAIGLEVEHETGGLVSPGLGTELEAAGYDRDFPLLGADARELAPNGPRRRLVRLGGRTVVVPDDVRIDLNGVVKSRTVDDAVELLHGHGWVAAGGDLAARGAVVVGLPRGGAVSLIKGGIATSGTDRRRWLRGGRVQHHLIDPRTGRPAASPWELVTVCGRSCLSADVAAKAAFLLGSAGPVWLDLRDLPGRFVNHAGAVHVNRAWRSSVAEAA